MAKIEYERNVAILRKFRDDYYTVTLFRALPKAGADGDNGISDSEPGANDDSGMNIPEPGTKAKGMNNSKFDSSLARSRSLIFQLFICNHWDYFCTMTINGEKHDRYDLGAYYKKLSKWINNYNTRNNTQIKYLLIPEPHRKEKDKDRNAWHMHGLMAGIPPEHLQQFQLSNKLPHRMRSLIKDGRELYNWLAYADKFGFVSLEKIINPVAVSHYLTKYISKSVTGKHIEINDHVYYCSKGLKRAKKLYQGEIRRKFDPDYMNEYVSIKTCSSYVEAVKYFTYDV